MKSIIFLLIVMLLPLSSALGEEISPEMTASVDFASFESFAEKHQIDFSAEKIFADAVSGDFPDWITLTGQLISALAEPIRTLWDIMRPMLVPTLMLALAGALVSDNSAQFLCRIAVSRYGLQLAAFVLDTAGQCLLTTSEFSDAAAPVLSAVLTASGRTGASALISPAAAMAANLIEQIYIRHGLRLCGYVACVALASNLCAAADLGRLVKLIGKLFSWGAGLAVTLFTALVIIRNGAASVSDSVAVRTAKFAVDSASGVIGSGVSDVWDTYLAGLAVAKGTVGLSGVVLLLSVCIKPMLTMVAAMAGLSVLSAMTGLSGDGTTARMLDQLSGVCRMTLTLCGSAMAIWIILMGSMLDLGRSIL